MSRKFASKPTVARLHDVTTRTVTNWHAAGFITGYKVPGRSGLLFDVDEVARAVASNPSMRTPSKISGRVVTVSGPVAVMPEVVTR